MKKVIKKVVKRKIKAEKVIEPAVEKEVISTLGLNLGREDLNALVGKLNEVIIRLNKCQ
jgi:hypothetical protein